MLCGSRRVLLRPIVGGLFGGLLGGSYASLTPPARASRLEAETMEEEAHGGGLQLADRRREALFKEQADNEFFWQAFKSAMASAGHRFGANTKPTDVFDFRFNEDFTDKVNTGKQLVRGGEVYSLPYGWKRYAVRVKGKYDRGDNTWLKCRGGPGEWAVAYHGTDHCNLPSILAGELRPGSGQVYQSEVGRGVYVTPNMKDATEYANVTRLQHNGEARNVRIVLQCRVRTSAIKKTSKKAYWVLNNPADIRPYGVLMRESSPYERRKGSDQAAARLTLIAACIGIPFAGMAALGRAYA